MSVTTRSRKSVLTSFYFVLRFYDFGEKQLLIGTSLEWPLFLSLIPSIYFCWHKLKFKLWELLIEDYGYLNNSSFWIGFLTPKNPKIYKSLFQIFKIHSTIKNLVVATEIKIDEYFDFLTNLIKILIFQYIALCLLLIMLKKVKTPSRIAWSLID